MPGVKRSNQERMAWFNPPTLQAGCVEELGTAPAYAIDGAATPRRLWALRVQSLAALRAALALLSPCLGCCCCFYALGARCFSGPLGGGEAGAGRRTKNPPQASEDTQAKDFREQPPLAQAPR